MRFQPIITSIVALLLCVSGAGAASPGNPTIRHCLVSAKDDIRIPAEEPGVLVRLDVREGSQVRAGELMGQIDDRERQNQRERALIEKNVAEEEARNDVDVRYARAAAAVAHAEYEQALEANRKVIGTFPQAEIRRLKLAWDRAELQIEQSQFAQSKAAATAAIRGSDAKAAETNIFRRQIAAPIDGEVIALFRHAGEWVAPGDQVLRLVRFDTLRVEGFLNSKEYDPAELAGRPVSVEVELARGRTVRFAGRVVYVSPLVQAGGDYRILAEVANRQENGQWVLRPGQTATMMIEVR